MVNAEYLRAFDGLTGNLYEFVFRRLDIDCAVCHCKYFVFTCRRRTDENEAAADDRVARFCLDNLKCRADSIRCAVGCTAEEAVRNAHLYEHCSEVVSAGQNLLSLFRSHSLGLAEFDKHVDHLIETIPVLRVDNFRTADVETGFFCRSCNIIRIAEQNRMQEGTCKQTACSFENTRVRTFCEDNLLRIALQFADHITKTKHCIYLFSFNSQTL